MVAGAGFEPATPRLCIPLRLSPLSPFDDIRGLDYPFIYLKFPLVSDACHLVSTPSHLWIPDKNIRE